MSILLEYFSEKYFSLLSTATVLIFEIDSFIILKSLKFILKIIYKLKIF